VRWRSKVHLQWLHSNIALAPTLNRDHQNRSNGKVYKMLGRRTNCGKTGFGSNISYWVPRKLERSQSRRKASIASTCNWLQLRKGSSCILDGDTKPTVSWCPAFPTSWSQGQDRRDRVHPQRRLTNPTLPWSKSTCKSESIIPLQ
jgi:hypothetical protein